MSASLTLFRFCADEQVEWLAANGALHCASLTSFAQQVGDAPLLLVVPGECATLHQLPYTGQRRSLWVRAAPYALEEQLVDDVETVHFAFAATTREQQLALVTVQQQTMHSWLATCAAHQLHIEALIPDLLLLPWHSEAWTIVRDAERLLVRSGRWSGFVSSADTWEWFSAAALHAGTAPQRIYTLGTPPPLPLTSAVETLPPQALLSLCAAHYPNPDSINLLQGQYAKHSTWQRRLYPWRLSAALLALLLLVQGVNLWYQQQQLQHESASLQRAMAQLYTSAVPGATRIVNPRAQLEGHIRALSSSHAAGSAFLPLLAHAGQALSAFPAITLMRLDYRTGQLDLVLQGGDAASLDQLRQRLQQPGFTVDMRTTQQEGNSSSNLSLKLEAR